MRTEGQILKFLVEARVGREDERRNRRVFFLFLRREKQEAEYIFSSLDSDKKSEKLR